mmetsp:Transcript_14585/g.20397  ORF Transcript_14585/g.20397 Transcript_14585/m.20397 type:complete len:151 (-) Transcript_14585:95-547(-)
MLMSAETNILLRQARKEGKDINKMLVKWQHEMFEHLQIHRDFGVESLKMIKINFPSDRSMPSHLMKFAKICQCAALKAMLPYARAGDVPRRFEPAKNLTSSVPMGGIMPKHAILKYFSECCALPKPRSFFARLTTVAKSFKLSRYDGRGR